MRKSLKHAAANIKGFGINKSDFAMLHKRKELMIIELPVQLQIQNINVKVKAI